MRPLPNRHCGPCTACCKFMPIETDKLVKPTNVLCPHCEEGVGCTVYDARPSVCAQWQCGWKVMRQIPDDWRPRESGLVFRVEDVLEDEITVTILDARPKLLSDEFASLIAAWHEAGVSLYFQTVGPPGSCPSRRHMNPLIASAIAAADRDRLCEAFVGAVEYLRTEHIWETDGLTLSSQILPR